MNQAYKEIVKTIIFQGNADMASVDQIAAKIAEAIEEIVDDESDAAFERGVEDRGAREKVSAAAACNGPCCGPYGGGEYV